MSSITPETRVPLGTLAPNTAIVAAASATLPVEKPSSKKRKAPERPHYDIDDDICQTVTISCSAVRNKINRFLQSGEMKVGEFMKEIGASSATYYNFMNKTGIMGGSGSTTYTNAFAFFKLRELNGVKITKKKKVEGTEGSSSTIDTDFGDIMLEREEENAVPVYDSCDEIRRKIRQYLGKTGMSQAAFSREVGKYINPQKKTVSGLAQFLAKKGPATGNMTLIFYVSYIFFEKMRIKNGNPKTNHRLGMEGAGLEAWTSILCWIVYITLFLLDLKGSFIRMSSDEAVDTKYHSDSIRILPTYLITSAHFLYSYSDSGFVFMLKVSYTT